MAARRFAHIASPAFAVVMASPGDDLSDAEATFAALAPPTDAQSARGWSRDWSAVWASHERKLASTRDLSPSAAADAWRSREDVVVEDGGRVQFFDVTGGPLVRLAKERAMAEQVALESAALERARRALLPDVVRVANMPASTLATGATIPLVGLGTWKSEPGRVRAAVETALKCGYRHVDCAAIYDNEGEVGEALARVFATTKLTREEVFITSKLWNTEHAPDRVEPALRKTLRHLRLDYLDLYLIHWPVTGVRGDEVTPPILDTWRAMEKLVDEGLVRAIGVSNFSEKKLRALIASARHPVSVCQVEIHPYWRQERLLEFCETNGVHVTAYSPLGSPDSAAMFGRDAPALMRDPAVVAVAERAGKNVGQVLVRWALQTRPTCSVLPKSADPERIRSNLDVLDWNLDDDDVRTLGSLATQRRMVDGSFWLSPAGPYRTLNDLWDDEEEA